MFHLSGKDGTKLIKFGSLEVAQMHLGVEWISEKFIDNNLEHILKDIQRHPLQHAVKHVPTSFFHLLNNENNPDNLACTERMHRFFLKQQMHD